MENLYLRTDVFLPCLVYAIFKLKIFHNLLYQSIRWFFVLQIWFAMLNQQIYSELNKG